MAKDSLPMENVPVKKAEVEIGEILPKIRIEDQPKLFDDLSCTEMMDVLAKKLIKWQNEFG